MPVLRHAHAYSRVARNENAPVIIWPDPVKAYLRRMGRDPVESCPKIETEAVQYMEALRPVLDSRDPPMRILDIGCGLALLDVHLARAYGPIVVRLLDGDGTAPRDRGFRLQMQAWADVEMGQAMFRANVDGAICPFVTVHQPGEFDFWVDLILSSRSWCHHYPATVYLDSVKRSLKPGGLLVVDIRAGTDGLDVLRGAGFEVVARVTDPSEKCGRFALTHWG